MSRHSVRGLFVSLLVLAAGNVVAQDVVLSVPLVQLILFPERYESEVRVEVVGFLTREAGLSLFMNRELAEVGDYASSIVVEEGPSGEIMSSPCEGYVRIQGSAITFLGGLTLGKIERIEVAGTGEVCWQRSLE